MAENNKTRKGFLTVEQQRRIVHPDWPEYLKDVSTHWSELILLGEYDYQKN